LTSASAGEGGRVGFASVVVVGASLAGLHAARALRKAGFGGRITAVDADPHTPYDKPPLSKQVLRGDWDTDRIALPAATEDLDIDWHLGTRATGLDLSTRTVTTERDGGTEVVPFDRLVLATGAVARRLRGTGDLDGVHVLRTLDDCLALRHDLEAGPSRVVVIGAGFIGSEVAAACRARELAVTVIEALAVPLERSLGPEMGHVVAAVHRDHDVDLRLGVGVDGIDGDAPDASGRARARVSRVRLSDGSAVEADVVVVGIGVAPATGWLEGSGLTLDNGVVVDETLEAAPGVVAAGDLARWPSRRFGAPLRVEHWENAIEMGEAAGRRLLAVDRSAAAPYDPVPWFWSDLYDRKIQLAGMSGADMSVEVVHGSLDERRFVALYGGSGRGGGRVVGVLGMNRPRHVAQLRALVADGVGWDEGRARARAL
jgi:3-phenylpropionate/trans-cinnamate dioxygenase ferredoxin reductase subunit